MTLPQRAHAVPALHRAVYCGPVGQVVRSVAPTTEADPVGVLVAMLSILGTYVGPDRYTVIGSRPHPPLVWPLLIGPTGLGRKGTAVAVARAAINTSFSSSFSGNYARGLSSGEGLIEHFADDENDRRLVVIEEEFATVLARSRREGNTISGVIRGLFDEGSAEVKNRKENALRCEGAHLGMIGQITSHELVERLAEREVAGGFVNRFMPVAVLSPHALPEEPEAPDVTPLMKRVKSNIDHARLGRYYRSIDAKVLWADIYAALRQEQSGRLADITVRGPAYVMRLALLYALIDGDDAIRPPHLIAAAALWDYVQQSARKVFGTSRLIGLDKLSAALRSAKSMTKTEIHELFGRNESGQQIDAWVMTLMDDGDVTAEVAHNGKQGRPTTRYFWTGAESPLLEVVERHLLCSEKHEENEEKRRELGA